MTSVPAMPLRCDHGLRRQAVVQGVLTEVFQGRLRAGQHLVTQQLADRYGVSHTPVREALAALSGIGIVELLPNRGAVVRLVTARDVLEVCEVRRLLECEAVRLACGRVAAGALERLQQKTHDLLDGPGANLADRIPLAQAVDSRLHDLVADSCGNSLLAQEIGRLKTLFRAFRDVAWEQEEARNDSRRLATEAKEHLAIIAALQAGRAQAASRAMAVHIRSGARYWSRSMPPNPGTEAVPPGSHTRRNVRS